MQAYRRDRESTRTASMANNQVLHINIPTAQGHLEAILKPEEEGSQPRFVSLVCHPHPLGGGTMHNKVVFKVAQALHALNIPALRFNFRGVGHSTGTYDEGRGELDDVRFALDFLSRRYPSIPVIVAGFSFGSYVGLRVGASDDRVQALTGLGVPAKWFESDTLQECHKRTRPLRPHESVVRAGSRAQTPDHLRGGRSLLSGPPGRGASDYRHIRA